jgi:23S rRNA (cytidine1920-2'-O)/16S rRNA (cytidine1409-2'-O)-methyltransferase
VLLVKPQFEAGRSQVGKGGVVRTPRCIDRCSAGCETVSLPGIDVVAAMPSPLRGADGNVEFFFHSRTDGAPTLGDDELDTTVDRAHTGAPS